MLWKRCLILFVVVIGGMFGALACGDPEVVEVVKEVPIGAEKIITVEVPVEQVRTVTVPVEVIVEKVVTREVTVIVTATPTSTPIPASDPTECLERDEKYLLDLAARFSAFEIYNELAGTTPRRSLANVISKMSDQQIDLISVRPATGCAGAYTRLADWMAKAIDSFSAFLAQKSDSHVVELIDAADQAKQSAALSINEALKSIGQTPILDVEGAAQKRACIRDSFNATRRACRRIYWVQDSGAEQRLVEVRIPVHAEEQHGPPAFAESRNQVRRL